MGLENCLSFLLRRNLAVEICAHGRKERAACAGGGQRSASIYVTVTCLVLTRILGSRLSTGATSTAISREDSLFPPTAEGGGSLIKGTVATTSPTRLSSIPTTYPVGTRRSSALGPSTPRPPFAPLSLPPLHNGLFRESMVAPASSSPTSRASAASSVASSDRRKRELKAGLHCCSGYNCYRPLNNTSKCMRAFKCLNGFSTGAVSYSYNHGISV